MLRRNERDSHYVLKPSVIQLVPDREVSTLEIKKH